MHKYGHMVSVNDRLAYDGEPVRVMDIWPSKIYKRSQWFELWTLDTPELIARPVAIVLADDFSDWTIAVTR